MEALQFQSAVQNYICHHDLYKLCETISRPYTLFNLLYTSNSKMRTLTNSEDPDEMPHDAAFQQGLHCCSRTKKSFKERNTILFGNNNL